LQGAAMAMGWREERGAGGRLLGQDPETGLDVTMRSERFGPYIQLGEPAEKEKPKRASIPKGYDAASIDLEQALTLLSLPRTVGLHPESGKPIVAGFGRYGPFIEHDGAYANLDGPEEVFTVGLNRAVSLIAERAAGKGRRQTAAVIKELGEHPDKGGKIEVLSGRYGPYVKHGRTNATLPKGTEPEQITLEQAVTLIAEREAKGGKKRAGGKSNGKSKTKSNAKSGAKETGRAKKAKASSEPARG